MTTISTPWLTADVTGNGPAILFVHGLGGTSNTFQPLIEGLNDYRLIRPDLPGAGRSKVPYEDITVTWLSEILLRTLADLGVEKVHLVGHSMGTLVCQHIAAGAPNCVESLSLFGPIVDPADAARTRLKDRAALARAQGMDSIADQMAAQALSSSTRAHNPIAVAYVRETHMRQDKEGFARHCEALSAANAADLRGLHCPALIVTGDEDQVAPVGNAQLLGEKLKGSKVRILERCGHWTTIERPIECSKLLTEFLTHQRRR